MATATVGRDQQHAPVVAIDAIIVLFSRAYHIHVRLWHRGLLVALALYFDVFDVPWRARDSNLVQAGRGLDPGARPR